MEYRIRRYEEIFNNSKNGILHKLTLVMFKAKNVFEAKKCEWSR